MTNTSNSSARTVYLHIGMSKAGSSAIQKALLDNQDVLHQHGFVYPNAGLYAGAHYGINEQLLAGKFPGLLVDALHEAGNLNPIISCEGFWHLHAREISLLNEALSSCSVKVILYLRNPGGYMPSPYRQSIKTMDSIRTQSDYIAFASERMDYSLVLKRWARHYPLKVKVYDQIRPALVEDFLNVLGVSPHGFRIPKELINPTLSNGAFEAMRLVNRLFKGKLARRARSWIASNPKYFSVLDLDDGQIREKARQTPLAWDMAVMQQFLEPEGLEALVKGTVLESGLSRPGCTNEQSNAST